MTLTNIYHPTFIGFNRLLTREVRDVKHAIVITLAALHFKISHMHERTAFQRRDMMITSLSPSGGSNGGDDFWRFCVAGRIGGRNGSFYFFYTNTIHMDDKNAHVIVWQLI